MAKFQVLMRVDAFVDFVAEVEAGSADEASALAEANEGKIRWNSAGVSHFDARQFVALDAGGNEIEQTSRGDF